MLRDTIFKSGDKLTVINTNANNRTRCEEDAQRLFRIQLSFLVNILDFYSFYFCIDPDFMTLSGACRHMLSTSVTLPNIFKRLESMMAIQPSAGTLSKGSTNKGCVGSNSTSADSNWDKLDGFSTLAPPVFLLCFQ